MSARPVLSSVSLKCTSAIITIDQIEVQALDNNSNIINIFNENNYEMLHAFICINM